MKQCRYWMCVVVLVLWIGTTYVPVSAAPQYYEVKNKEEMYRQLVICMREREEELSFWYPGIQWDVMQDRGKDYDTFFDKLSNEDGYVAGGVDSIKIQYVPGKDCPVTYSIQYRTTLRQETYVDRKVRRLVRRAKKRNVVGQIQWARDYLLRHMQYDRRYYTAYDAFRRERGNCMAYSYAFLRLMQELDVPCVYVSSQYHAWNMVKLEGRWYYVDITWENRDGGNLYFLKGKNDFPGHDAIRRGLPKKGKIARTGYISQCMRK